MVGEIVDEKSETVLQIVVDEVKACIDKDADSWRELSGAEAALLEVSICSGGPPPPSSGNIGAFVGGMLGVRTRKLTCLKRLGLVALTVCSCLLSSSFLTLVLVRSCSSGSEVCVRCVEGRLCVRCGG